MRAHFFKDNNKGHESETLSFQTEGGQFIAIDHEDRQAGVRRDSVERSWLEDEVDDQGRQHQAGELVRIECKVKK
ncbi:hypothetical protein [Paenibacillus thiaminolyticus]|uniref:Uncharacterized protein n=1 Tax=Paenibacillus thiaminolyticus TaxID=49283 RepID=A0A3A3GT37_PANTH|nr:hypothetical protein [Paenibacillus thiaminolyticus]RJG26736.1 hypothetical protein DQX05_01525 [Paenibacillus thiaminolyticus]